MDEKILVKFLIELKMSTNTLAIVLDELKILVKEVEKEYWNIINERK